MHLPLLSDCGVRRVRRILDQLVNGTRNRDVEWSCKLLILATRARLNVWFLSVSVPKAASSFDLGSGILFLGAFSPSNADSRKAVTDESINAISMNSVHSSVAGRLDINLLFTGPKNSKNQTKVYFCSLLRKKSIVEISFFEVSYPFPPITSPENGQPKELNPYLSLFLN